MYGDKNIIFLRESLGMLKLLTPLLLSKDVTAKLIFLLDVITNKKLNTKNDITNRNMSETITKKYIIDNKELKIIVKN